MGDPVTTAMIMGGFQVASSIGSGMAQKKQLEAQAQEYDMKAVQVETNAALQDAERAKQLQKIIASQNALFAARGIGSTSGTAMSLMETSMSDAAHESAIANKEAQINSQLFQNQASSLRATKSNALSSSIMQGLMDAGMTIGGAYAMGGFSKKASSGGSSGSYSIGGSGTDISKARLLSTIKPVVK